MFVIRDNDKDTNIGTLIHDKLFGTTVDTSPRPIPELEKAPLFVAKKESIMRIELKKPGILSGHMTVTVRNGGSFRIHIDTRKTFAYIEWMLNDFYPEAIWEE